MKGPGTAARHLAVLRIVVFGVWFVRLATTTVSSYGRLPPEAIEPVGIMRFVPTAAMLADPAALETLRAIGLVFLLACIVGLRPWRPIALIAFALVLWHDGAMKATQAYVNHGQALALFCMLALALAPAADAYAPRRRRDVVPDEAPYEGALLACLLLATASYSFVGVRRLVYGGWAVFTDGTVERWVAARSGQYAAYEFRLGLELVQWRGAAALLAIGMLIATLAEAGAVLILVHRRLRLPWLAVVLGFHLSTLLLMNIFFWETVAILLALFIAPVVLDRQQRRSTVRQPGAADLV